MNKPHWVSPENTTGKKGLAIKFALAVMIGLLLVTSLTGCVPKAPHEHFIAALKLVNDLDYQEFVTKAAVRIQSDNPEYQKFYEIFNQVTFEITTKLDKVDRRFLFDLNLLYKGGNCGNLTFYCDLEKITAQSVFLGPKTFYINWNDLQQLIHKYFGFQVQITDYFPLLLETDEKTWEQVELAVYDFYTEYYRDKITAGDKQVKLSVMENGQEKIVPCKELILQMDQDDFAFEEMNRMLQGILGNPAVRTLVKDKITQFITIAKNNGDLATWPITEEQIIAFRDNLDLKIDHLLARMTAAIVQIETATPPTSFTKMDGKIYLDRKGLWRSMVAEQTMDITDPNTGEVSRSTIMVEQSLINPGQKPAFPELLPATTVNVGQISADEWATIAEDVSINFFTQVMLNPLIRDIVQLSTESE
ncbi:hypothetical protein [Capillibacterium thermochitinicola]|uniref:Uncharacterized protein n=1 Tax=Capillibacterium thermochitinicola TaxID=2699427 RepID=A0A8J6HWP1_9FIRM|nr:hypothetical protein [Capillibacterium thermochitinicola]MBA2132657.1 hypothetical protein [Capillibacterium thermochitinicola]